MKEKSGNPADRILIIDDTPSAHEAIRKALERERPTDSNAGDARRPPAVGRLFQVDSAFSGEDGLKRITEAAQKEQPFALAFVDMRMPGGWGGIQTVRALWEVQPDLQIILCRAYADSSWENIIQELGDTDRMLLLRKPFEREEILQFAHMLTRKWNRERHFHEVPALPHAEPLCLLLLEDEPLASDFIQKKVKDQFPQVRLLTARTIAEAQDLQSKNALDFLLLDIFLEDGTGIDFLFQVLANQPTARAVFMTAQALGEYRSVAEQMGVLRLLEKPVDFNELAPIIQDLIDAKISAAHDTSRFAATLTQLTTIDIIQLKCIANATATLEFTRNIGSKGRIWFAQGQVVHAEVAGKSGEAAFVEIVGWPHGRVQEVAGSPPPRRTIDCNWQGLLLNTAHLLDEESAAGPTSSAA